jgi:hypothetical protein
LKGPGLASKSGAAAVAAPTTGRNTASGGGGGGKGKGGGGGGGGEDRPLNADALRLVVVARAKATALAALKAEAAEVERRLQDLDKAAASSKGSPAAGDASMSAAREALSAELAVKLVGLRGEAAAAAIEAKFSAMGVPGVVMGEDELQALADVRRACVQVRSLICVEASSDVGSELPAQLYHPKAPPSGGGYVAPPRVGGGDTLVLLQEMRAHRMSHFQLVRLPTPSPPPRSEEE